MKVIVGVVGRGRPGMILQCLQSAYTNAGNVEFGAVALFDDDHITAQSLPKYEWLTTLATVHRLYYVRTANMLARYIVKHYAPDYFVITDDDTEFTGYPWAEQMANFHKDQFPDGIGVVDMMDYDECCHIFTTPATLEWLNNSLYDPRYLQFYHDTVLLRTLKAQKKFAYLGVDASHHRMMIHKRDFVSGAGGVMTEIRELDYLYFKQQAKDNGWPLYGDDLR